jgi:hypothetical protein
MRGNDSAQGRCVYYPILFSLFGIVCYVSTRHALHARTLLCHNFAFKCNLKQMHAVENNILFFVCF